MSLDEGDFAPWLTIEEGASDQTILEVWYETESGWRIADDVGGRLDLHALMRLDKSVDLQDNAVLLTLSTDPRSTFYIPLDGASHSKSAAASGVVERSKRETRMKKGVGLGGLHQYIHVSHLTVGLAC